MDREEFENQLVSLGFVHITTAGVVRKFRYDKKTIFGRKCQKAEVTTTPSAVKVFYKPTYFARYERIMSFKSFEEAVSVRDVFAEVFKTYSL